MELLPRIPRTAAETRTLQLDFSWKKFAALISEYNDPRSNPIYVVDLKRIKAPHFIFKSAIDDSTVGAGTLHPVSINADYEVHGRKGTLRAQRRFKTLYTYRSHAFSDNNNSLVTMTWTTRLGGFKTWDFICMDEQQMPVAKFSANFWAITNMGKIEFLGPKANSDAVRDEIVVTALTLLWCMVLRFNNVFSLFGAVFYRPGHDRDPGPESQQQQQQRHFAGNHDQANASPGQTVRSRRTYATLESDAATVAVSAQGFGF